LYIGIDNDIDQILFLLTGSKTKPVVNVDIPKVITELVKNETFVNTIVNSPVFVSYVTTQISEIVHNETFISEIINSETFQEFFVNQFTEIINNEEYITNIINEVVHNENLYEFISNTIVNNESFVENITNEFIDIINNDTTLINNIVNQVIEGDKLYSYISETIHNNSTFITNVSEYLINEIDMDEILTKIAELLITSAISLIDPNGNSIATQDENGNLIVQIATDDKYGIVNLSQIITLIRQYGGTGTGGSFPEAPNDGKQYARQNKTWTEVADKDKWDKMTVAPDHNPANPSDKNEIAKIDNRDLIIQQATPQQFGVVKCGRDCVCYRKPIGLKSIDGLLEAVVKHDRHLFFPMVITDRLPPKIDLLGKLTFVVPGRVGGRKWVVNKETKDYIQEFSVNAIVPNPDRDYIQEFSVNAYVPDPARDFIQEFSVNAHKHDATKDFTQKFSVNARVPNETTDYTQEFSVSARVINETTDYTQDFPVNAIVPDETTDYIQHFSVNAHKPDSRTDYMQDFPVNAIVPNETTDFIQDFPVNVIVPNETTDYIQEFPVKARIAPDWLRVGIYVTDRPIGQTTSWFKMGYKYLPYNVLGGVNIGQFKPEYENDIFYVHAGNQVPDKNNEIPIRRFSTSNFYENVFYTFQENDLLSSGIAISRKTSNNSNGYEPFMRVSFSDELVEALRNEAGLYQHGTANKPITIELSIFQYTDFEPNDYFIDFNK
jgi:hypothetical protein